ncbi:hypothetical protein D9619_009672 [Psilocybe cf. subviscida]|uniref:Uncharacterized protein n=1 Tax=Psilocybe cf. subviscida TaxID=2480587 RepID=A0A8H5BL57_9AGAR|nr:hypothetical protein D9619_009672 [Psilocybe cf. subviscida]
MGSSQSTAISMPVPQPYEEGTEYVPPSGHVQGKEKDKKRLSRVDLRGPLRAAFGRGDAARSREASRVRSAGSETASSEVRVSVVSFLSAVAFHFLDASRVMLGDALGAGVMAVL